MYSSRAGKICLADGCETPVFAREMCRKHYARWRTNGHPTAPNHRERYRAAKNPDQSLTQEYLKRRLSYDPETGEFYFKSIGYPQWDNAFAGKRAGKLKKSGYVHIQLRIGGKKRFYSAHRLAWLYVYGYLPKKEIDHINRDRSDNRISNLRLATKAENGANRHLTTGESSQFKGVTYAKRTKKWQASFRGSYLGQFADAAEAAKAYDAAARSHYGEFALTNADMGLL